MALLPQQANTENNNETSADRSALPAGDYLVHIVKSEMKQTKAKNGHYLSLHMQVLSPEDKKGRFLFSNLNLDNPNPVAMEIANKELNSICQACDQEGVEDSEELHQLPFMVTVKVDPATAQWPEGNSITAYKAESEYEGDDVSEYKSVSASSSIDPEGDSADGDGTPSEGKSQGIPWEN